MTTAVMNETYRSGIRTQVVGAARRFAHVSHEARLIKSLATDAVEDAVHATNHAIKTAKRRVQDLADRRYEVAHRIRQQPFKAIGMAFGAGVFLGVVTAVMSCTGRNRAEKEVGHP
jgi:ElaB/YqjD/DUF883 family membrane-anchored ribosome-binding protein